MVAGSLAAGAVTALVLTLVVFAGATEAVITGSMLLGFGLGWALIAVLSARMTEPAAALGSRPGRRHGRHRPRAPDPLPRRTPPSPRSAGSGRRLCWRSWSGCSSRCAVTCRPRPLAAHARSSPSWPPRASAPPTRTSPWSATRTPTPPPGQTYEVGGHRLHLDCRGQGGPTVVLFNGLGEISASWARITDQVGTTTRVCAYDRAGQGWSEDAASPQDGVDRRRGPAPAARRGRRGRPLRPGRPLHRRHLRPDLRRPVPRAGRRHGAARQLQPRAAHQHPELRRPVRRDAARPRPAAHPGPARPGPRARRLRTCPARRPTRSGR